MDFELACALDVLPFGLKSGCTAVTIGDENLWKADAISIWKTGGTPYQEAKSFKEFEKLLPQLKQVKTLYVAYRISESLFDAICKMDGLERLEIAQASQKSLESITNLQQLTHLEIRSCPHLESLAPLSKLKRLKALGMSGSFKKITQLDTLAELVQLNGLSLAGGDSYIQYYDSLDPLASLVNLQYFGLAQVKTGDRSLSALCAMKQLQCIHIVNLSAWPKSEYEKVHRCLPMLDDEELRLAATDTEFQKKNRIR